MTYKKKRPTIGSPSLRCDLQFYRRDGVLETRFVIVEQRGQATLHRVIIEEIELGTTIWSDEWRGYRGLETLDFGHERVNHSVHFVDPNTGVST